MDTSRSGQPLAERDEEFAAWSGSRRRRLAAAARSRGLNGLLIRCSDGTDPSLAPLLPVDFATRSKHRVGGGVLVLGAGQWGFRPHSPWELEEVRSLGLSAMDPRLCAATPSDVWSAMVSGLDEASGDPVRLGLIGFGAGDPWADVGERSSGFEIVHLDEGFVADRLRVPSPMECEEVDRVCDANVRTMCTVARLLAGAVVGQGTLWLGGRPLTIGRLRRAAEQEARSAGLSFPEGCLVSAGPAAANPHDYGDDSHRLCDGEPIVVDLFPRGALFSDMTRTFVPGGLERSGTDTSDLARAIESVREALEVAEKSIRGALGELTGRIAAQPVQREAQEHLRRGGWSVPSDPDTEISPEASPIDEGFVHGLGHGVGYDLHQAPWFSREEAGTERGSILPGEAFTLEPGLYRPSAWGVRLEDVYRIEPCASGSRSAPEEAGDAGELQLVRLTSAPRSSDPAGFLYEFARGR